MSRAKLEATAGSVRKPWTLLGCLEPTRFWTAARRLDSGAVRRTAQPLKKPSNSSLTLSLSVVHMPWGAPL
jgi:hypothetical protein